MTTLSQHHMALREYAEIESSGVMPYHTLHLPTGERINEAGKFARIDIELAAFLHPPARFIPVRIETDTSFSHGWEGGTRAPNYRKCHDKN